MPSETSRPSLTCDQRPLSDKVATAEDGERPGWATFLLRGPHHTHLTPPDQEELRALLAESDEMLPVLHIVSAENVEPGLKSYLSMHRPCHVQHARAWGLTDGAAVHEDHCTS